MTSSVIQTAKELAISAHEAIGQVRKYTNEPYWKHCERVAYLVSLVTHDKNMQAAAWLHDVIEDVYPQLPEYSLERIEIEMNTQVRDLVWELTDKSKPEDGNREARKRIDRETFQYASKKAKTVKLADIIDNSVSIIEYGKGFAPIFIKEVSLLLPYLKDGDKTLFQMVENILKSSNR